MLLNSILGMLLIAVRTQKTKKGLDIFLNEAFDELKSVKMDKRGSYRDYSCRLLVGFCNIK